MRNSNSSAPSASGYDILSIGETVIDFTPAGISGQGNALYEKQPGGAPANMMTQAALLGAKTCINGLVGSDPFGHYLAEVLQSRDISTEGLVYSGGYPTHCAILEIDRNGERTFFSIQTESSLYQFSPEDVRYDLIDRSKIIHTAGAYMSRPKPLSAVKEAIEYACSKGKITSCDINWRPFMYGREYAREHMLPVLRKTSVLKLSADELELLTGMRNVERGTAMLADMGIALVVITRGSAGCYFRYCNGDGYAPSFPVEAIDTNAAGDAFLGVLLKNLASYDRIEAIPAGAMQGILACANAAGALCASKRGAICAMSSADEIHTFMKKHSFEGGDYLQ